MATKKTVLVLFGGESSEHDVSIMSARNVVEALNARKYEVVLGYISRDGKDWRHVQSLDDLTGDTLQPVLGQSKIITKSGEISVDVLFPVLHGKHGEDGTTQGFANLLHTPCVGPGVLGAALTMDKLRTKQLLRSADIPVVPWLVWRRDEPMPTYSDVSEKLGESFFVKPVRGGSSVGVSRVDIESDFVRALNTAAAEDDEILLETAIDARELETAVMGNANPIVAQNVGEISSDEFYDYDSKYADSSTSQIQIPADVDESVIAQLRHYAREAYVLTSCRGMARVDFFMDRNTDEIYLNEINSIPGFTNISMYPKLWQSDGMDYPELIDKLIEYALE